MSRRARPSGGAGKPARPARFSGRSDRFGTVPFGLKPHQSPHGQVTAVSMMKDEGPFVIEWIAHQIAIGFTDIVVYTNDCSDGTDLMLARLEELGLAHHRVNAIPPGLRPQPSALNHAQAEPVVRASDWLMVFDADEFLAIRHGDGTLDDLIGAVKAADANGIVVTWRIFGSGGIVEWSRDPVTEQYLKAAPPDWNKGWGVKTLFAFDDDHWLLGIHRPKLRNKWIDTEFPDQVRWLNGSGRPMEDYFKFRGWRSIVRTIGYDWVQLNHYAVKSADSYAVRRLRGNVNDKKDKYNSDYWALQDRNETTDTTQLRYRESRGAIIAALLTDPVLRELHFAALERVESRLAGLRDTDGYRRFRAELAAASGRPIGEILATPPKPRDRVRIAGKMSEVERRRGESARAARRAETAPDAAGAAGGAPEAVYPARLPEGLAPMPVEWHPNRGVLLPADPRLFTPAALRALMAGKFERGLARRLPALAPPGARVLEVGAGCGFLAAVLAQARDDLAVAVQEDAPALGAALALVLERNGLAPGAGRLRRVDAALPGGTGKRLVTALQRLIRAEAPDMLILSDPRLTPAVLAQTFAAADCRPATVFVLGRAAAGQDPAALAGPLRAAGYREIAALERRLGCGFARDPEPKA